MTGNYRIVLVLDGGEHSLSIPVLGLNHIAEQHALFINDSKVFNWIDVAVGSGNATLLTALIAQNKSDLTKTVASLEHQIFTENKTIAGLLASYFQDETLLMDLKKHFSFVCHDKQMDEPYFFSSTRPTITNVSLNTVLKACVNDIALNRNANWGNKQLAYASLQMRNPIFHAANLANCLYHDESLIFLSIGSGLSTTPTEEQLLVEQQHEQFQNDVKLHKNWHYFRFNPIIENDYTKDQLISVVQHYFETEISAMERLMRLMEMKSGRIL
jgi:hypothetical protein